MIDPFRFELVGQRVHIPKGSAVRYWHLQGKKIANKENQKYSIGRMEVDVGGIRRGEEVGGVWHDCSKNQKSLMTEKKNWKCTQPKLHKVLGNQALSPLPLNKEFLHIIELI